MTLSIIIVNYNVKYFLEQCLNSILASNTNFRYEIIVIDNNSTDNSLAYLQPKFNYKFVYFISNDDNPGFSKANNQGISIAKGKYILLLNPDTVLGENVLQHVVDFCENTPFVGAVGVKMINGYGKFLAESKRGIPTPWASFCKLFGLESLFPQSSYFGKYSLLYLDKHITNEVSILAGAFMMIPSSVLKKVGLLDESFFMYGEDIDISYRIMKAGYKNFYLPETILHYKGESTNKQDVKYINAFYNAMIIFYQKHYSKPRPIYSSLIKFAIQSKLKLATCFAQKPEIPKSYSKTIFDSSQLSYEEILSIMESETKNDTQYFIYSPKTKMIIGHKSIIQTDKDVSRK